MKRGILIFINVALFITFVNLAIIVATLYFSPPKTVSDTEKTAQNALKKIAQDSLPPYAPDWMSWRIADIKDPQSLRQATLNIYLKTTSNIQIPNRPLAGKEWVSTKTYKTNEEYKKERDFTKYYMDKLEEDGWRYALETQETSLHGVAANSEQGNVLSYLKLSENTIQLFILSSQTNSTTCPCTVTYRVLIQVPIDLKEIQ